MICDKTTSFMLFFNDFPNVITVITLLFAVDVKMVLTTLTK